MNPLFPSLSFDNQLTLSSTALLGLFQSKLWISLHMQVFQHAPPEELLLKA